MTGNGHNRKAEDAASPALVLIEIPAKLLEYLNVTKPVIFPWSWLRLGVEVKFAGVLMQA